MQRIALSDGFFQLIRSGSKTSTIRYGHRDYKLGVTEFYSETSNNTEMVKVVDLIYKTFGEIEDRDALMDGFSNKEVLKDQLRIFYPNVKDNDEITKVIFSVLDRTI